MPIDYSTNTNKGYGFVVFKKASEAAKAVEGKYIPKIQKTILLLLFISLLPKNQNTKAQVIKF